LLKAERLIERDLVRRQFNNHWSRREFSMGLDLVIVKKFANLLGGDTAVESEVGKGSKFTITIPMALKVSYEA